MNGTDDDLFAAPDEDPDEAAQGGAETAGVLDAARLMEAERLVEAVVFAAAEPVGEDDLAGLLGPGFDVPALLARVRALHAGRGVELVRVAGRWQFRTAPDLAARLSRVVEEPKKPGRAALETLAIIAYHQPVTRAEIEQIRGVSMSRGTLDTLLEAGWVRMRGRRRTPGRPITWGTTDEFLVHFGLASVRDLPGLDELKAAGLLEGQVPAGFRVPLPVEGPDLTADEDPLEEGEKPDLFGPEESG